MLRWGFDLVRSVFHNAGDRLRYLFGRGMCRDGAKEKAIRATAAGRNCTLVARGSALYSCASGIESAAVPAMELVWIRSLLLLGTGAARLLHRLGRNNPRRARHKEVVVVKIPVQASRDLCRFRPKGRPPTLQEDDGHNASDFGVGV